jgi:hypothetical protein
MSLWSTSSTDFFFLRYSFYFTNWPGAYLILPVSFFVNGL